MCINMYLYSIKTLIVTLSQKFYLKEKSMYNGFVYNVGCNQFVSFWII